MGGWKKESPGNVLLNRILYSMNTVPVHCNSFESSGFRSITTVLNAVQGYLDLGCVKKWLSPAGKLYGICQKFGHKYMYVKYGHKYVKYGPRYGHKTQIILVPK